MNRRPMGPYETMDFAGLDIYAHVRIILPKHYRRNLNLVTGSRKWSMLARVATDRQRHFRLTGGASAPAINMSKADPNFDPMDIVCLQVNEGTKLLQKGVQIVPRR